MDRDQHARLPLAGRCIAITRPSEQAPTFAEQLEAAGARVVTLPTIAIASAADTTDLDHALANLATFDWVILTSVNGVHAVADRLTALGLGWEARGRARIAVIGPATARALEEQGVTPDYMPDEYVAEAILDGLGNVAGQRVLLARADIARRALADALRVRGADVVEVAAYRTIPQLADPVALRRLLEDDRPDAITFTSSSTVTGLMESIIAQGRAPDQVLAGIILACIGPITAETMRTFGLAPAICATDYTIPGLLRAIIAYFSPISSGSEGV